MLLQNTNYKRVASSSMFFAFLWLHIQLRNCMLLPLDVCICMHVHTCLGVLELLATQSQDTPADHQWVDTPIRSSLATAKLIEMLRWLDAGRRRPVWSEPCYFLLVDTWFPLVKPDSALGLGCLSLPFPGFTPCELFQNCLSKSAFSSLSCFFSSLWLGEGHIQVNLATVFPPS